jgi:hypothetical protein
VRRLVALGDGWMPYTAWRHPPQLTNGYFASSI